MTKINAIGNALGRINDATFQELGNKFLKYKYDFKNIIQTGSVLGKEKTRKGTPDTIFINNEGGYIFVEYTTLKRDRTSKTFISKIKDDINKCFDPKKTEVDNNKIVKIIICHTEKLKLKEIEEFKILCKSFNNQCDFEQYGIDDLSIELDKYPSLLKTYLNISIDTGQLMQLSEYINYYEKPDLSLATPLSNLFYGRKEELDKGFLFLSNNNLLLISGAAGVGKTRFAIELCRKYKEENKSYEILCFSDNGNNAYEDLQTHLYSDKDYLIVVDDANRAIGNYNFILYLLKKERKGKVKILVTVRDYATDLIENTSMEYNFEKLILNTVPDENIEIVLKESFNIHNNKFISRICSIAKGNLRIAVMCALVVLKEKTLGSLNNICQLYNQYFNEIYQKIIDDDKEETLKVLGIISFFRVVAKNRTDINRDIYSVFNIDEQKFWDCCKKLNRLEVVDLYEYEIVKISDQVLSTFLFHKAFFEEQIIDFNLLIKNYIEYDSYFYDSLNPIFSSYDYNSINNRLKVMIEDNWCVLSNNEDHSTVKKIFGVFWFCLVNKTLSYFYNYISSLPKSSSKEYIADYDHNEMATYGYNDKDIISILANFRHLGDENTKNALELMFLYVEKKPEEAKRLSFVLNEKWMIIRNDFDIEFRIQHLLIDYLIEKIKKKSDNTLQKVFFYNIASKLLKTRFIENDSKGNKFTIYTIHITLSDSIKQLRKKIWDVSFELYEENPDAFYKLLIDLNFEKYDGAKKLWTYDSSIVLPILFKLNYKDYKACEGASRYLRLLKWNKIKYDKTIESTISNRLFDLNKLLTERDEHSTSDAFDKKRKQNIASYCKNFTITEYVDLLGDIEQLKKLTTKKTDYSASLTYVVEDALSKGEDTFIDLLCYAIDSISPYLWSVRLMNVYFGSAPKKYEELFFRLNNLDSSRKLYWLLEYHSSIPASYLDISNDYLLIHFYDLLSRIETELYNIESITNKYSIYQPILTIYSNLLEILISNISASADESVLTRILDETKDYSKCEILYLRCKLMDEHYDHDRIIFTNLLQNNPRFIIGFLDSMYTRDTHMTDYYYKNITPLWTLPNHKEIAMIAIDYFITKDFYSYSEDMAMMMFSDLDEQRDRAIVFITNFINEYHTNNTYMELIFDVIANIFPDYRNVFLKQYLKLNQDFNSFERIDLFPRSMTTVGSRIPYIQNEIDSWNKILDTIKSLNMGIKLINHIAHVEKQIKYKEEEIKREAKYEFMDKYRS